ncbi:MAG TPA: ABC transporter permease [Thermomicrobiales bacterium]|nr:ABC transporter permease [Thermomicrobiales bacterium]
MSATQPTGEATMYDTLRRLWADDESWMGRYRTPLIAFGLILVLLVISGIRQPGFLSFGNLRQQLVVATFLGTVAAGQTMVILTGGIDLSVAWNLNFAAILFTQTIGGSDDPATIAFGTVLALLSGTMVGVFSGIGVAILKIPSLVATLGMNTVMLGVTLVYTNGSPQGLAPAFARDLAIGRIWGVLPWALVFWACLTALMIALLKYSVFGRRIYAIGNNPRAAFLSGAPVRLTLIGVYAFSGLTAGMAGILLAGYSNNTYLGMGDAYVLQSIAAVVIGGTSILGGAGGYGGTVAGAILIVLLQNALQVAGIRPAGQQILYGLIILLMLFVYGRSAKVRE